MDFSAEIGKWYRLHKRELPWRNTRDPYIIWLSEIILQQTRVEQGLPYFQRFTEEYPNVKALAKAPLTAILKLWQGLGYYSRARNLHTAANQVVNEMDGIFPSDYHTLLKLKGVGTYSAAAIASFSANQKVAVVDGNVYRLLSRYFGIHTPIDTSAGKKEFMELATSLLPRNAGAHNQAIMEFGAIQCKPAAPACDQCPLRYGCVAFHSHKIKQLPVKTAKQSIRVRHFNYLDIRLGKGIYLHKRSDRDIWKELYELPLIETSTALSPGKLVGSAAFKKIVTSKFRIEHVSDEVVHKLSHQTIRARFFKLTLRPGTGKSKKYLHVPLHEVHEFPVPKLVERYLERLDQT